MYKHHKETIEKIVYKLKDRSDILGILVGGSIAHGFAKESSDVDIMIIVSNENYKIRLDTGEINYWEDESCDYENGYVDGKYICVDFMEKVAKYGSEPARYAFKDSIIVYSKLDNLNLLIKNIVYYPSSYRTKNIKRFYAQFEGWKWYFDEALKHKNSYLMHHAISNIVLFGGRLILAHNESLYPYHKWFLKTLEECEERPADLINLVNKVYNDYSKESVEEFYNSIVNFRNWECFTNWSSQFVMDSELTWMKGKAAVADI